MKAQVNCPHCQATLGVPAKLLVTGFECPNCKQAIEGFEPPVIARPEARVLPIEDVSKPFVSSKPEGQPATSNAAYAVAALCLTFLMLVLVGIPLVFIDLPAYRKGAKEAEKTQEEVRQTIRKIGDAFERNKADD